MLVASAGIALLAGCASSKVAQRESTPLADEIARPKRVVVYDFAGTRDDLPPDSAIARYYEQREVPQTQNEIYLGRQLGRLVAENLVKELNGAGIAAQHASSTPQARVGDAIVRGEFIVVMEGSRTARVLIGFGAGAGELKTLAEAYQVTADGLRPLGATQVHTAGGKLPGMLVPLGIGAGIGAAATSAAVGGTSNVMQERGPEAIRAAAQRTAKELARLVIDAYRKRGWL
jgi:hypothetical protein